MKFILFDHPNMQKPKIWIDVEKISSMRVTDITTSTLKIALTIQGSLDAEVVVQKPGVGGKNDFFDAIGLSPDELEKSWNTGD